MLTSASSMVPESPFECLRTCQAPPNAITTGNTLSSRSKISHTLSNTGSNTVEVGPCHRLRLGLWSNLCVWEGHRVTWRGANTSAARCPAFQLVQWPAAALMLYWQDATSACLCPGLSWAPHVSLSTSAIAQVLTSKGAACHPASQLVPLPAGMDSAAWAAPR